MKGFSREKPGTSYTPLGPWGETEVEGPENVSTEVAINGELRAPSGSFNLPSSVGDCLVYAPCLADARTRRYRHDRRAG